MIAAGACARRVAPLDVPAHRQVPLNHRDDGPVLAERDRMAQRYRPHHSGPAPTSRGAYWPLVKWNPTAPEGRTRAHPPSKSTSRTIYLLVSASRWPCWSPSALFNSIENCRIAPNYDVRSNMGHPTTTFPRLYGYPGRKPSRRRLSCRQRDMRSRTATDAPYRHSAGQPSDGHRNIASYLFQ